MKILPLALAAGVLAVSSAASANTVFSENFNAAGFQGAPIPLGSNEQFSDRWADVVYTSVNDFNGWDFSGTSYYVRNLDPSGDGAVLLNEDSGMALHLLSGLTVGKTYKVTLLVSGDNRPGGTYVLKGDVNGVTPFTFNGTDLAAGTNPGTLVSYTFKATLGPQTLNFYQAGNTGEASPIIDNVTVASVPEPAGWALMIAGFGGIGAAMRRRRALAA